MRLTVLILGFGDVRLPWIHDACRFAGLRLLQRAEALSRLPAERIADCAEWWGPMEALRRSINEPVALVEPTWLQTSVEIDLYVDDLESPGVVKLDTAQQRERLAMVREDSREKVAARVDRSRWLLLPNSMTDQEKVAAVVQRVAALTSTERTSTH